MKPKTSNQYEVSGLEMNVKIIYYYSQSTLYTRTIRALSQMKTKKVKNG